MYSNFLLSSHITHSVVSHIFCCEKKRQHTCKHKRYIHTRARSYTVIHMFGVRVFALSCLVLSYRLSIVQLNAFVRTHTDSHIASLVRTECCFSLLSVFFFGCVCECCFFTIHPIVFVVIVIECFSLSFSFFVSLWAKSS